MFVGLMNSAQMYCLHEKSTFTARKKKREKCNIEMQQMRNPKRTVIHFTFDGESVSNIYIKCLARYVLFSLIKYPSLFLTLQF